MSDFEVTGGDQFYALSKAIKNAGRTKTRTELNKSLKKASKPLIEDARDAARLDLPHRGGLADRIAKQTFTAQVLTGEATAGVRITRPGRFVTSKLINQKGAFRRPVFADAKKETRKEWNWVPQPYPQGLGWFDRAMTANAPKVRPELEAAMQRVIDQIVREAGHG